MSSFMSSPIILIAVLAGVTVAVTWLSVTGLRTYTERRTRRRNEEVAEQVKKQLADLRNSRPPQQKHVDQGDYDVEDTGHEAAQRAKEVTGQSASQAQGTVGQYADQRRATEAEPWATFHRGSIFDRQGEYARAVEAYQQVIDSGHPEAAPRAAFNLGILFEERGEYDRAVEAYRRAIASEHAEWAPKAAFDLGVLFEQRGAYDLAEEAYQQAINSGHPEVAPEGVRNLRGLRMRYP
jgi:tetratricopeptide (TPR) repeat protein